MFMPPALNTETKITDEAIITVIVFEVFNDRIFEPDLALVEVFV